MTPLAGHHKIADGLACSGSQLALAEFIRQRGGITRVADGESGDRLPAFGDGEDQLGFRRVEAGHLVDEESELRGLNGQKGRGSAGVVKGVAVGSAVVEVEIGDGDGEDRGVACPSGVEFDKSADELLEIPFVFARGDEEGPRLLIVAGGRPASGLEQAAQDVGRDWLVAESARAPATAYKIVDR